MTELAPEYSRLAKLTNETSSDGRRELLRAVTSNLFRGAAQSAADFSAVDELIAAISAELPAEVRAEIASLIAASMKPFHRSARQFAMDQIEVAMPVLKHSRALTERDLLDAIAKKSQDHMLAVSARHDLSQEISQQLAEHGDDRVAIALLENEAADIGYATYEQLAVRAETTTAMHAPFVRRKSAPLNLLNDLYLRVEAGLRQEILRRYDSVSPEELDLAFARSRRRLSNAYGVKPPDFGAAQQRIDDISRRTMLAPPMLIALMREGKRSRTVFELAFSRLVGVEFDLVHQIFEARDLDAIALLCRGSEFERAIFVAIAVALDGSDQGLRRADEFSSLYESVSVQAAQRALRFWKLHRKM